jgi:putative hemolysin
MIQTSFPGCRTRVASVSPRGGYQVRIARSEEDVRAAQLLRFMVFNVELREGLEQSFETCLDADRFDPVCDHLLIEETATGEIVGTYRLQTGLKAAEHLGYYSAQEFDFTPYEHLRGQMIELGRACIHSGHRSFAVLNLLWKGIARYAREHGARYLTGCSSLTSRDPAEGAAAYLALQPHLVASGLRTRPVGHFPCPLDTVAPVAPKIPKLLAAYLALGARICGPPALDREFKTIDFLTLLDLQALPFRTLRRLTGMHDGDTSGNAADISA